MGNRLKRPNSYGVFRATFNVSSSDGNVNLAMRLKNVKAALNRGVEG